MIHFPDARQPYNLFSTTSLEVVIWASRWKQDIRLLLLSTTLQGPGQPRILCICTSLYSCIWLMLKEQNFNLNTSLDDLEVKSWVVTCPSMSDSSLSLQSKYPSKFSIWIPGNKSIKYNYVAYHISLASFFFLFLFFYIFIFWAKDISGMSVLYLKKAVLEMTFPEMPQQKWHLYIPWAVIWLWSVLGVIFLPTIKDQFSFQFTCFVEEVAQKESHCCVGESRSFILWQEWGEQKKKKKYGVGREEKRKEVSWDVR